MSSKTVAFGEIMLRLATPGNVRFVQTNGFEASFGGGEANVAVALAGYGLDSYYVTRLPEHEIGQSAVNALRRYGVNTKYIVRGGERIGIYFLERGASQRPSKVIYDRSNSSVTEIRPEMLDWDDILEGAAWFHWTGITPALGKNLQECLKVACKTAKKRGVTVSCDLNFRRKLWSEAEAQSVMNPLMEFVDVCIANEEDIQKSLGFDAGRTNVDTAELDVDGYFRLAEMLREKYGFTTVAITLRESYSASRNGWSAILHDDKDCSNPTRSRWYDIRIVDRVGSGDSFASGLIYGLLQLENTKDALEFATAASCLKQTIPGDFNLVSKEEVLKLARGTGSGRVER